MSTLADEGIDLRGHTTGQHKVLCPRCSHTRHKKHDPCLSVNIDAGRWHCWNCNWEGGVTTSKDDYGTVPKVYRRPDYVPAERILLEGQGVKWLHGRGITDEVIVRHRIEYRRTHMPQVEGESWALAFPYFRGGEVINVKWRGPGKVFRMEKDAELCLYNLDAIDLELPLIWTEGEIDALSVEVTGVTNVVSVPNGAPQPTERDSPNRYRYINADWALLRAVRKHIIAVDNDEPGRRLAQELVRRLGPARCALVAWPEDCKDANDVLLRHGMVALRDLLLTAEPVPVDGLYDFDVTAIQDYVRNGVDRGVGCGSPTLDEHYRVKPGYWTLVTGIPSHGKSGFMDWFLVNVARKHDWVFALCSPESQPMARHGASLISLYTGLPIFTGNAMTEFDLDEGGQWVREHFKVIMPEDNLTVDHVLELAEVAVLRHGIKGLVIDPWNELDHSQPGMMREDQYISAAITKVRQFARAHAVHVWIIAHPTKMTKENGKYDVPRPYDVSGAAHWANKADMALSIYREILEEARPTEVHIQKVRNRESGELGMVELWYDKYTGRYSEQGPDTAQHSAWGQRMSADDQPF